MSQMRHLACYFRRARSISINSLRSYYAYGLFRHQPPQAISFFLPRTINFEDETPRLNKQGSNVPDHFEMIYRNRFETLTARAPIAGYMVLLLSAYAYFRVSREEDTDKLLKSVESNFFGIKIHFDVVQRPLLAAHLLLIYVLLLLLLPKRILLRSYFYNDKFISIYPTYTGFGRTIIYHGPQEYIHYPKRKVFNHELHRRKVILFPEFFVHYDFEKYLCIDSNE